LKNEDDGDFVAIDIETGAYEIDEREMAACDRPRSRCSGLASQSWVTFCASLRRAPT
jgi:hypothetical protein